MLESQRLATSGWGLCWRDQAFAPWGHCRVEDFVRHTFPACVRASGVDIPNYLYDLEADVGGKTSREVLGAVCRSGGVCLY